MAGFVRQPQQLDFCRLPCLERRLFAILEIDGGVATHRMAFHLPAAGQRQEKAAPARGEDGARASR